MDTLAKLNRCGSNDVHAAVTKHEHGNNHQQDCVNKQGEYEANPGEEWVEGDSKAAVLQPAMVRVVEHYLVVDLYFEYTWLTTCSMAVHRTD